MGDVQKLSRMLEEQSLETAKAINRARRAEAKLEAMERAFRGRGYHEPGIKRCQHGMVHWIGDHCKYDEPALAAAQEEQLPPPLPNPPKPSVAIRGPRD